MEDTNSNRSSLDSNSIKCRICFSPEPVNSLVSPCNCKGTVANVHIHCLENWLTSINYRPAQCEICKYEYSVRRVPLHNALTSLAVWCRLRNHRTMVLNNFKEILLQTVVTMILVGILACMYCFREPFFVSWIKMYYVISILVVLYFQFASILLILDKIFLMWYIWWKSTHCIKLMPVHIKKSKVHSKQPSERISGSNTHFLRYQETTV